jgi:hypothetical protein
MKDKIYLVGEIQEGGVIRRTSGLIPRNSPVSAACGAPYSGFPAREADFCRTALSPVAIGAVNSEMPAGQRCVKLPTRGKLRRLPEILIKNLEPELRLRR